MSEHEPKPEGESGDDEPVVRKHYGSGVIAREAVTHPWQTTRRLGSFSWRVLKRFGANQGLLLAGGVAYNALLSLVPLIALVMILLSFFFTEREVIDIIDAELLALVGPQGAAITNELALFLENRDVIGWIGFGVLIFFSSLAFRMLESAMAVIFSHHPPQPKPSFWKAALQPYAFAGIIGVGLVVLTTALGILERGSGAALTGSYVVDFILFVAGFVGQVLLFAAIYRVMPAAHVSFSRAMAGSVVAALLWETTRRLMTWYFANLSLVSVVYGSFATVIIILLIMEVAAIIVLLGAQVIAELELCAQTGVEWYEAPEPSKATL